MKIGCLLLRRPLKKKFLREVLLPLFFGLLIGYLIGTLYTSKSKEEDAHAHSFVKEVELGSYEYANGSYFFLRCLVLVHPDAKKPLSFIMAIRDTYGQQCNQTIFYTANPEVQRRVNDQQVYLIQQNSNGFYWNFFRTALKHSSAVPAMWTIVLDEQVFLKVSNLRRTLVNFDFRDKVLLGRVMESTVFNLFPFMSNARLSLQAGIVMSNSALQSLLLCDNYILPRTTEKTILECSQEHGITVIDPVDEARMHLFHYKAVKSLISNSQDGGHSCCSDHAVTFGQHSFKEIRMAHYASETWVVFGTHGVMEVNKTYAIDRSLLVRTTTLKPKTTVPTKKPDTKKAVVKKKEPKKEKPKKKPGLL